MNCPNCQNPVQEGEKFCGKCGGILQAKSSWLGERIKSLALLAMILSFLVLPLHLIIAVAGNVFTDSPGSESFMRNYFIYAIAIFPACSGLSLYFYKKGKAGISLIFSTVSNWFIYRWILNIITFGALDVLKILF